MAAVNMVNVVMRVTGRQSPASVADRESACQRDRGRVDRCRVVLCIPPSSRGLVEAGFAKRIMFGSDFPNQVGPGIDAIIAADFLNAEQKADVLCNNAARFLRLEVSVCRP